MSYGLYMHNDKSGYINLSLKKTTSGDPLSTFSSLEEGKTVLNGWMKKYELCQKLCGLYDSAGACFNHQIHECHGACIGEEFAFSYNMRVNELLQAIKYESPNMAIIDRGRHADEKSVVWVENGTYQGYGYFDNSTQLTQLSELKDVIDKYPDNRDIQQIINAYLRKNKRLQVEKF